MPLFDATANTSPRALPSVEDRYTYTSGKPSASRSSDSAPVTVAANTWVTGSLLALIPRGVIVTRVPSPSGSACTAKPMPSGRSKRRSKVSAEALGVGALASSGTLAGAAAGAVSLAAGRGVGAGSEGEHAATRAARHATVSGRRMAVSSGVSGTPRRAGPATGTHLLCPRACHDARTRGAGRRAGRSGAITDADVRDAIPCTQCDGRTHPRRSS